jgi:hypothetical protein
MGDVALTDGRENPDLHHHHDEANKDIEAIHDRMPVILSPNASSTSSANVATFGATYIPTSSRLPIKRST